MAAGESNDDWTQSFAALTKYTAISHHKIIIRSGSGGMGNVHMAKDTSLGCKVTP